MKKIILFSFLFFLFSFVYAQDFGFGFGFDDFEDFDEENESSSAFSSPPSSALSFKAGGNITVELPLYFHKFTEQEITPGDIISGKLNLSLFSNSADAFLNFNLNAAVLASIGDLVYAPLFIDEAYIRLFLNSFNIEAGLRKLSWGRADSSGPLDVTNPVDFSDLRKITDGMARKIARPMLHVTWNTGNFSKLEGVFIPNYKGHIFATEGRWAPTQMLRAVESELTKQLASKWTGSLSNLLAVSSVLKDEMLEYYYENIGSIMQVNTNSLKFFQAGLRFSTTLGSADLGTQYYYGHLFRPALTINGIDLLIDNVIASGGQNITPEVLSPKVKYTRYHQIGIDYAQVLLGFNIRAELAFNLTEDYSGDDGTLQNPFIGWSFGFDRDLLWGIGINLQVNETIRMYNGRTGDSPVLDPEAGAKLTSTRLTTQLTRNFFRDNLESKLTFIWDIENTDFYIIPAAVWNMGDLSTELCAGIFAGKETGELGQYRGNSFVRLGLTYKF